jgi:PAS domain S-box-containing protein
MAHRHDIESRLAAIVASSDDAIVSKDLNGIILTWNRGAERMFGYTPAEAVGQSIRMIVPAGTSPSSDAFVS